jgi:hypothetical protein
LGLKHIPNAFAVCGERGVHGVAKIRVSGNGNTFARYWRAATRLETVAFPAAVH